MDFYHGSIIGDLKELRPFSAQYSNLPDKLVYLTTSKQLATHYIWNINKLPYKMPMLKIGKDGVLVFQEMFSGALAYFYQGLSGYVYYAKGDYELSHDSGVFTCAISKDIVPIHDVEYIDDVYDRILEYSKYGTFIYERYEELPQYRHDIIRGMVLRMIKSENLLDNKDHPLHALYQEKHPRIWEEAMVLSRNGLL